MSIDVCVGVIFVEEMWRRLWEVEVFLLKVIDGGVTMSYLEKWMSVCVYKCVCSRVIECVYEYYLAWRVTQC